MEVTQLNAEIAAEHSGDDDPEALHEGVEDELLNVLKENGFDSYDLTVSTEEKSEYGENREHVKTTFNEREQR